MCDVKVVTCSEKPTENYDPALQFSSALRSILALAHGFGFGVRSFNVLVHSRRSHQLRLQSQHTFSSKEL